MLKKYQKAEENVFLENAGCRKAKETLQKNKPLTGLYTLLCVAGHVLTPGCPD